MASVVPPPGPPATTIEEVIVRMQSISALLPPGDGVACFNRMYLEVTEAVQSNVQGGSFADPTWVSRLDVVFANLYFAAIDAMSGPSAGMPTAWVPLTAARDKAGIEPIQFALAGMNAHINHDLPLAVVATCRQLTTFPTDGSHHADYQKVDGLLDTAEQSVRESFEPADVRGAGSPCRGGAQPGSELGHHDRPRRGVGHGAGAVGGAQQSPRDRPDHQCFGPHRSCS